MGAKAVPSIPPPWLNLITFFCSQNKARSQGLFPNNLTTPQVMGARWLRKIRTVYKFKGK